MEHRCGKNRKVKRAMELDGVAEEARPLRFGSRRENRTVFEGRFRQCIGFGEQGDQGDGRAEHVRQNTDAQEECNTGQANITKRHGHGSFHCHTQVKGTNGCPHTQQLLQILIQSTR